MRITHKQFSCGYAGLFLAALAAALFCGCGAGSHARADAPAAAPIVSVVKVSRGNLSNTLEIASEFQPFQQIYVYAKVSGYIKKLSVDWGTHVRTGDVMAVLEIPELEQQLQVDEAVVRRNEQAIESAREELNRAQSSYGVAHVTYQRLADVQKSRPELVAQQDIDVAQGKDQEASAALSGAKDALAGAQQALLGAKAALDKDKAVFAYARITAPFDGVVTHMYAFTGSLLPAGTASDKGDVALCQLSQNNLLRLVIPVPERAVPDLRLGDIVDVNVSSLDKTFQGKIARFSGQIDLDTRTMHTEVQVPNPKYELVPGMYASVDLPLHTAHNVLMLPVQAVQDSGDGKGTVLIVDSENHIEKRDVTLGLQTATKIEVVSGLKENELAVFGEQSQFKTGQVVTPLLADSSVLE